MIFISRLDLSGQGERYFEGHDATVAILKESHNE